jgi:hypothetical protein
MSLRRYDRHWTPVHLDVVVEDWRLAAMPLCLSREARHTAPAVSLVHYDFPSWL